MKSKHPTKKEKAELLALMEQLDWMFAISNFTKKIHWHKEDSPKDESPERSAAAEVSIHQDYQTIIIKIFPTFWEIPKEERRQCILHEYCHLITTPVKLKAIGLLNGKLSTDDNIRDADEEATSKIASLLDDLLRGKLRYIRNAYKKYQ